MPKLRSGKSLEEVSDKMPGVSPVAPPRPKHVSSSSTAETDTAEVKQLRECVLQLQHSVDSLKADFQSKLECLSAECKEKANVNYLKTQLDLETGILISRIETVEQRLGQIEAKFAAAAEYNTETTVIARGLPTQATGGTELLTEAKKLVQQVLGLQDVQVARAKRLPSRNGYPGLVKVQLNSLDDKKSVLRAKHKVKEKDGYHNVYIRSSKTHVERLLELNFNALLNDIPNGHTKYRMTANGRLVRRDEEVNPSEIPIRAWRGRGGNRGSGRGRGNGQARGGAGTLPTNQYIPDETPEQQSDQLDS